MSDASSDALTVAVAAYGRALVEHEASKGDPTRSAGTKQRLYEAETMLREIARNRHKAP